jgi:5-methylcytosine-specific restriction enzyme subunit McrC
VRRVAIREHMRIAAEDARAGSADVPRIPRVLYERLRRFDEAQARTGTSVFTWYAHHAQASHWVGVMRVEGLQVELLPKTHNDEGDAHSRDVLLWMLWYANEVPVRPRDLAAVRECQKDLGELLSATFAEKLLQELLRGTDRAYIAERENLGRLRGRLLVREHVVKNAAHRERFFCEHDELVADTPINRVFRAACVLLLSRVRSPTTLDLLERSLGLLDEVSPVTVTTELFARIALTRQNERFAPLLAFCRMLFEGSVPTTRSGGTETFSLLYDMNHVFERFVAGFVQREVIPKLPNWRAFPQSRGRQLDLYRAGERGVLRLKPDLLLDDGEGNVVVLDTKWKRLVPRKERSTLSREDLYQLYAYGQRFRAKRSILLYPELDGLTEHALEVLGDDGPMGSTVDVRYIRIDGIHSRAERARLAEAMLRVILGRGVDQPRDAVGGA